MPIYEFECDTCGAGYEEIYLVIEIPRDMDGCSCGGEMKRIISKPGKTPIPFQHGGWDNQMGCYVNDNWDRAKKMKEKGLIEI